MTCDEYSYVAASKSVTYIKGLKSTVTLYLCLGVGGGGGGAGGIIVTCTQKTRNYVAASTVTVT